MLSEISGWPQPRNWCFHWPHSYSATGGNGDFSLNSPKTKLVTFPQYRAYFKFVPVLMIARIFNEVPSPEHLLWHTLNLKWKSYRRTIGKNAGRMVGSLYHFRKCRTPTAMLSLYMSQNRPRIEYCCHICHYLRRPLARKKFQRASQICYSEIP